MRGLCLCAVLAACGGDGTYIEVRVPEGMPITRVELFVATSGCHVDSDSDFACDAIAPPPLVDGSPRVAVEGEIFFADPAGALVTTDIDDGSAFFYFPRQDAAIKAAIAVGHTADGNAGVVVLGPDKIALNEAGARRFVVELQPAVDSSLSGLEPSLELWSSERGDASCIGAQVDGRRLFIVPEGDLDCDGVEPEAECDANHYLLDETTSNALVEQSCPTTVAPAPECVLGTRACSETLGTGPSACVPSTTKYCVPTRVCECTDLDRACFDSLLEDSTGTSQIRTRVDCRIRVVSDMNNPNTFTTCPGAAVPAPIDAINRCATPELAKLPAPQLPGQGPAFTGFATAQTIVDDTGTAMIQPQLSDIGCAVGLRDPEASFLGGPSSETHHFVLKIDAAPAVANTRFMLLPLDVTFVDEGDCSVASQCTFKHDAAEMIAQCFE